MLSSNIASLGRVLQQIVQFVTLAIIQAQNVFRNLNEPMVITSMLDGVHSHKSLHYAGQAVDIRRPSSHTIDEIMVQLKYLGPLYDIVLEPTHIHIEYQPKLTSSS